MLCALLGEDEGKLFVQYICLASWITVYQAIFCYKWSNTIVVTPLTFDKAPEAFRVFVKVRGYNVSDIVVVCISA
jgi:VanZ family protein